MKLQEHSKWLRERGLYEFATNFVNFKKNILKLKICNSLHFAYLLIINNPYLLISKIVSSFNTLFFTIKFNIIRKRMR